jgi:hypothetical protein
VLVTGPTVIAVPILLVALLTLAGRLATSATATSRAVAAISTSATGSAAARVVAIVVVIVALRMSSASMIGIAWSIST